jgi:hypothetical protein
MLIQWAARGPRHPLRNRAPLTRAFVEDRLMYKVLTMKDGCRNERLINMQRVGKADIGRWRGASYVITSSAVRLFSDRLISAACARSGRPQAFSKSSNWTSASESGDFAPTAHRMLGDGCICLTPLGSWLASLWERAQRIVQIGAMMIQQAQRHRPEILLHPAQGLTEPQITTRWLLVLPPVATSAAAPHRRATPIRKAVPRWPAEPKVCLIPSPCRKCNRFGPVLRPHQQRPWLRRPQ